MCRLKIIYIFCFRFTEMPTNNFVESSFWNFDALFQPQQHPARDAHDTFFLKGAVKTSMDTFRYLDCSLCTFQPLNLACILCVCAHTITSPDPMYSYQFPMEYLERVKRTHERGGYGSTGYQYDWKFEEAQKNILRTHTTAVSARMLYKLGQQVGKMYASCACVCLSCL